MLKRNIDKIMPAKLVDKLKGLVKLGYIPNISSPETFNEKLINRKYTWTDDRFIKCSDKVEVKDYVSSIIGEKYIIPNLFVGEEVTPEIIKKTIADEGGVVVKANHNSGPVYLLDDASKESTIDFISDDINRQLKIDYGKRNNETWYSKIPRKVLIEKRIMVPEGVSLEDYKFHVFTNLEKNEQTVILHVDFERFENHNRSFFTEDLEYLPFSFGYPTIKTSITRPSNFEEMLSCAKKLAEPFEYVRVDFYNVDNKVYFGELTFAHGAGWERFTNKQYDLWMGRYWN